MTAAILLLALLSLLAGCDAPAGTLERGQPGLPALAVPIQSSAPALDEALIRRGREVFLGGPCAMCHTVRGTMALSRVGPDLTHVASRRMLAAGAIPNTRGHLAGWLLNPQNLKPGTRMPPTLLSADELHALLAYLETLR